MGIVTDKIERKADPQLCAEKLDEYFKAQQHAIIAYSGGVDSALLAYAAHIALHHPPPLAGLQHQFPPQLLLGQELGQTTAPLVVISNKATHS